MNLFRFQSSRRGCDADSAFGLSIECLLRRVCIRENDEIRIAQDLVRPPRNHFLPSLTIRDRQRAQVNFGVCVLFCVEEQAARTLVEERTELFEIREGNTE